MSPWDVGGEGASREHRAKAAPQCLSRAKESDVRRSASPPRRERERDGQNGPSNGGRSCAHVLSAAVSCIWRTEWPVVRWVTKTQFDVFHHPIATVSILCPRAGSRFRWETFQRTGLPASPRPKRRVRASSLDSKADRTQVPVQCRCPASSVILIVLVSSSRRPPMFRSYCDWQTHLSTSAEHSHGAPKQASTSSGSKLLPVCLCSQESEPKETIPLRAHLRRYSQR
jgi:hypothetical protein